MTPQSNAAGNVLMVALHWQAYRGHIAHTRVVISKLVRMSQVLTEDADWF